MDSLIEFLDPKLSSSCEISSDGVSDDYYQLNNLISTNPDKRKIGFMTFSVAKPPIEILLKFKWKINLKVLKVFSVLSSLKSTKFQIYIQCLNFDGTKIFKKVGDVTLEDNEIGFCLKAENTKNSSNNEGLQQQNIFSYARRNLKSVQVIKIVIQDTVLRRAPVIKKIEVWGYPSRENSKSETFSIFNLWKGDVKTEESLQEQASANLDEDEPTFIIPDEFLDMITNELVVMPFILPSGKLVDETTIQKHNRQEELYGRLPSDPFTGLIYTSGSRPKFDEVLKIKLDEFKLRNSDAIEVKHSGRTIGRKPQPVASTSNFYNCNGHISKKIKLENNTDLDSLISSIYKSNQVTIFTKPKKKLKLQLVANANVKTLPSIKSQTVLI